MAYDKQTWTNGTGGGTPTSATRFNHMEDGIEDADTRLTAVESEVDGKADAVHVHTGADITSGTVAFGRLPTGTSSSTVSIGDHTHDTRYYTETEVDALLDAKQDVSVKPFAPVDLTDAGTVATNAALGTHFRCALSGSRTLGAPTNPTDGQVAVWELTAVTTDRTVTLATGAAGFVFGTSVTEVPTIASGTTTYVQAVYRSSASRWRVIGVVGGY